MTTTSAVSRCVRRPRSRAYAGLVVAPGIFDIDRHAIPVRGDEPAHLHYDVRYVVRATDDERFVVSAESFDLRWMPIQELATDPLVDESVHRMARAWLGRTDSSSLGDRGTAATQAGRSEHRSGS